MGTLESIENLLSNLSGEVSPILIDTVKEAAQARQSIQLGEGDADPVSISELLVSNRRQIERLEYLTSTLVLLKSRTAGVVATARGSYDDKIAQAATKTSVSFGSYETAEEKKARFNVAAVEEQIALRKAERVHRDVDSAWDYCRILLRGAEGVQNDLVWRLKSLSLSTQLER